MSFYDPGSILNQLMRFRQMEEDAKALLLYYEENNRKNIEDSIVRNYEAAFDALVKKDVAGALAANSASEIDSRLFTADQNELLNDVRNNERLKQDCRLVIRVVNDSRRFLKTLDGQTSNPLLDTVEDAVANKHAELKAIRKIRNDSFSDMMSRRGGQKKAQDATESFWKAISMELRLIDYDEWAKRTYAKARNLLERNRLSDAEERFRELVEFESNQEKRKELSKRLEEIAGMKRDAEYRKIYDTASQKLKSGKYHEAENMFLSLKSWKDASEKACEAAEKRKQNQYERAIRARERGDFDRAIKMLKSLGSYRDARKLLEVVRFEQEEDRTWREREEELRIEQLYNEGREYLNKKKFKEAQEVFEQLGQHLDSSELAYYSKRKYAQEEKAARAVSCLKNHQYERALELIEGSDMMDYEGREELAESVMAARGCVERMEILEVAMRDNNHEIKELEKQKRDNDRDRLKKTGARLKLERAESSLKTVEEQLASLSFFELGKKSRLRKEHQEILDSLPDLVLQAEREEAQKEEAYRLKDESILMQIAYCEEEFDKVSKELDKRQGELDRILNSL